MNAQTDKINMAGNQPTFDEVIRCEQLTKRYSDGNILAVDRLNLRVHRGEIFGLLGPNGAGKTTTVGMLTTLVVPTGGKAIVAGIDVVAHPALVKQMIGVVALVAESKFGYKWAKWVTRIEISDDTSSRGFWESYGYNNNADINGPAFEQ